MSDEAAPAAEPKAAPVEAPAAAPSPAADPASQQTEKQSRRASDKVVDKDGNVIVRKDAYTADEVTSIVKAAKKNTRYITKREVEAFYQGRESAAPKPQEKPAVPIDDKPPTRDQYPNLSWEEFTDLKTDYVARKAARDERASLDKEQKETQERTAQAERIKTFQTKVTEKYPDLSERAEAIAHVEMPPGMGDAISESEFGPDILNHFVENPKDFERIAALSPSAAIREVGKLEARLEGAAKPTPAAAAAPATQKPSAAPAPLKPVGGTAVAGTDDLSTLVNNPQAWRAAREKQLRAKRAGSAQ